MRRIHKVISILLFICVVIVSYKFQLLITEAVSQNLTTFFSVVFGFYITGMAIIYSAKFSRALYEETDPLQPWQRKIHTLKNYFQVSGYWAMFSITSVIVYSLASIKDQSGNLIVDIPSCVLPVVNFKLDVGLLISSMVFSIASINIFFMILLLNTMIDGMLLEAKKH